MLRRVARVLRIGLLMLGVTLLVWTVVSYFVFLGYQSTSVNAFSMRSLLVISIMHTPPIEYRGFEAYVIPADEREFTVGTLFPTVKVFSIAGMGGPLGMTLIRIPLWLLAFLCLAWPVTSFVIARRRRRGRGFEVEAKADSAVSTVDS